MATATEGNVLEAQSRTPGNKNVARRVRQGGKIPGVVYGAGKQSRMLGDGFVAEGSDKFAVGAASLNALRTNDLDLAIGRIWDLSEDFQATAVFEESFVVVIRKHHPATRGKLSLDDYLALDHILVSFSGGFWGMVDQALKRRRLKRRVVASVPMFMTAMSTAAQSNLAATVPARLAAKYAKQLGLAVFDTPLKIDPFTISLVRHARSASDPGLDWLSHKILQAGQN